MTERKIIPVRVLELQVQDEEVLKRGTADRHAPTRYNMIYLTIRLLALVFYEQIVNEAQPSWLSLVENEGE